jgi:rifampicin phosphotransferase
VDKPSLLRSLDEVSRADVASVGGKAAGLGEVIRAGCRVPAGFAVVSDAPNHLLDGGLRRRLDDELVARARRLGFSSFAVRSSAIVEDGSSASWAGQFLSFLGVLPAEVPRRVRDCWSGAASEHARAYGRRLGGLGIDGAAGSEIPMGVVVQGMVESEVSGVLFTLDPVSREPGLMALEAVAGLGEMLVQGLVTPESYLIEARQRRIVEQRPHRQSRMLVIGERIEEVQIQSNAGALLSPPMLDRLVDTGTQLEEHFSAPQDIEWAISGGELFVLQSRPITSPRSPG